MILWISSVPDGHPRARKAMLGLVRPFSGSEWEVQMAPLTMCWVPVFGLAKAGAQLPAEARLLIRLLGNVLLLPASHHHQNNAKASLRSERTPGNTLESRFIGSLFSPEVN